MSNQEIAVADEMSRRIGSYITEKAQVVMSMSSEHMIPVLGKVAGAIVLGFGSIVLLASASEDIDNHTPNQEADIEAFEQEKS